MMTNTISNHESTHDWRWQIVQNKNGNFDGAFFTAVRTTGIYCKPSCRAKTPKPENVTFYRTCEEAEANGFRACLRCRPQNAEFKNPNVALVLRACELLERADDNISLAELGAQLNVSTAHLQRTFKDLLGVSPKDFQAARRLENFKLKVRETDVTTALYDSGFGSSRALYEKSRETLGMTPAQYKRGGENMRINYTVADSSLGKMLVAATAKGVCKISFGDDQDALINDLKQEFPFAQIEIDEQNILHNHVHQILQNLWGKQTAHDLPLDVRATAFQLCVWAELRKIPRGETRSYKQIAQNIGNEKAVRAVARACATNPIAVINPCHRVVGADGKMTGYRWGVERKRKLLEQEKQFSANISKQSEIGE